MTTPKATDAPKYYATKDFTDAGTDKRFDRGNPMEIDEGTFANYEAAGLASTEKPAAEKTSTEKPAA